MAFVTRQQLSRLISAASSVTRGRPPTLTAVRVFCDSSAPLGGDEWQRWHKLDTKDEREKLDFALFLGRLQERFSESTVEPQASDSAADTDLQENRSDITFFKEVKMGCVERLIQDLALGKRLSLQCITNLLDLVAPLLKAEPNVVRIAPPSAGRKVVVVGDLHGSLADLLTIFDMNGLPSPNNVFIFNGDFVDRGSFGLEVLMVLLACKVALPECVFLNRGNHEDRLLCQAYGFHDEVLEKANKRVFQDISGVFSLLPLATVIDEVALVVHGGLPSGSTPETLMEDLAAIPRSRWKSTQRIDTSTMDPQEVAQLTLLKDVLWSDPDSTVHGTAPNPRGAGCLFGDDIVLAYLSHLGLKHLVRSHQPFFKGFATTRLPDDFEHHTIFSASDYCGSQNFGAVVVFTHARILGVDGVADVINRDFSSWVAGNTSNAEIQSRAQLGELKIIKKTREALQVAFRDSGFGDDLSSEQCSAVIRKVMGIELPWCDVVEIATNGVEHRANTVHFPHFLRNYEDFAVIRGQQSIEGAHMYKKQQQLQAVFSYFDNDGDGTISRDEWMDGCRVLNQELPEDQQFDGSRFFDILDMNSSNQVSLNELCEGFRISNLNQAK